MVNDAVEPAPALDQHERAAVSPKVTANSHAGIPLKAPAVSGLPPRLCRPKEFALPPDTAQVRSHRSGARAGSRPLRHPRSERAGGRRRAVRPGRSTCAAGRRTPAELRVAMDSPPFVLRGHDWTYVRPSSARVSEPFNLVGRTPNVRSSGSAQTVRSAPFASSTVSALFPTVSHDHRGLAGPRDRGSHRPAPWILKSRLGLARRAGCS